MMMTISIDDGDDKIDFFTLAIAMMMMMMTIIKLTSTL